MKTTWFGTGTLGHIDLEKREWGWLLAIGIALLVIGGFAFATPVASTVGLTLVIGGMVVASGIVHLIHAFRMWRKPGLVMRLLYSVVSIFAGGYMLAYPSAGMLALTLVLAFYFFVGAASRWILAQTIRPLPGWGLGVASSIASFVLGLYIVFTFPISALWVPGMLLGIDLTFNGAAMIALAFATRRVGKLQESEYRTERVA